jgi:hypothetical protein
MLGFLQTLSKIGEAYVKSSKFGLKAPCTLHILDMGHMHVHACLLHGTHANDMQHLSTTSKATL